MKYILLLISLASTQAAAAQFDEIIYSASGDLCTVAADASSKERCLRSDRQYGSPAWRPKGDFLVVESGVHDGPSNLVLINENGKTIKKVPKSGGFIRPEWSPGGKYFFALSYNLGRAIGRWNANGTEFMSVPIQATEPFQYVQMVTFSPNGSYAALLVDDFKKMLIARVTDAGFNVEKVLPTGFSYVAEAAWLDNSRLIFVGKHDGPYAGLWELNVVTGATEPRGIAGLYLRDFIAVSPDRSSAVVCATEKGAKETRWSLWKYQFASSATTRLTSGIEDVEPTWRQ
jgi:WD40 repeat protein